MEGSVATWLGAQGLKILEQNYRIAAGELDIIARDEEGTLVFVEVRARDTQHPGCPEDTVDRRKQALLRRVATHWLVRENLWEQVPVRFDVVAVDLQRGDPQSSLADPRIVAMRWYPDAFGG